MESFICREKVYPWLYAAGILLGELLVIKNVRTGEMVHLLLLGALLLHAAFYTAGEEAGFRTDAAKFYLALTLAPLIRILNLSLPLNVFPLTYWYAVVSFPLLVGAVVVARINGYQRKEIGLGWGGATRTCISSSWSGWRDYPWDWLNILSYARTPLFRC